MDYIKKITNEITQNLCNKFDDIFIEGLRLKGYVFNNKYELDFFVKNNCKMTEDMFREKRIYYINDEPFLLHYYKVEVNNYFDNGEFKLDANYGYYKYL